MNIAGLADEAGREWVGHEGRGDEQDGVIGHAR